ncbi:hypothetical protein JW877_04040 [bacterium]|nr:hypothetical protein [bacterium]
MKKNTFLKWTGCLILFLCLIGVSSPEEWHIQLGIETPDYDGHGTGYADWYNMAGVKETASRGYDPSDAAEMLPPEPTYIILYFPHDDPAEPDYWPPPHSNLFSYDFRPPGFNQEIWHLEIWNRATSARDLFLWWKNLSNIPFRYGLYLYDETDENYYNIREQDSLRFLMPRGTKKFQLIVRDSVNIGIRILPYRNTITLGERVYFNAFLYEEDGDSFIVQPQWLSSDTCCRIEEPGLVFAVAHGRTTIVADYFGLRDSLFLEVTGSGERYNLELKEGWNLFSMPVLAPNMRKAYCLPFFQGDIYSYNSRTHTFNTADSLRLAKGYFAYAHTDTTLLIIGNPVHAFEFYLEAGWHLFGTISFPISASSIASDPPEALFPHVFWYSPRLRRYEFLESITPGKAFWLFVDRNAWIYLGD